MSPQRHNVRVASLEWSRAVVTHAARLNTPAAIAATAYELLEGDTQREHMWVVALDTRHRAVGWHLITIGCLDAAMVHPADVFRFALLAGAGSIVLVHNHPSGEVDPSSDDRHLARRFRDIGELMGVPLVDFVIAGDPGTYCSFREKGFV